MSAPLTPEQVADVLDDAADYIEANGWHQGAMRAPSGSSARCAIGAVRAVCALDLIDAGFYVGAALVEAIPATHPRVDRSIVAWNDEPGRTKQEVLDAFRLAAKQQRGRSPA